MPTYEYECPDCGHAFELFQSMTAKVKRTCPECGSRKLKRLIGTGGAVLFKGGGFYETDYRSAGYKKDAKAAESKPKKDAESKSSGASKTKESSGSSQSSKSD